MSDIATLEYPDGRIEVLVILSAVDLDMIISHPDARHEERDVARYWEQCVQ